MNIFSTKLIKVGDKYFAKDSNIVWVVRDLLFGGHIVSGKNGQLTNWSHISKITKLTEYDIKALELQNSLKQSLKETATLPTLQDTIKPSNQDNQNNVNNTFFELEKTTILNGENDYNYKQLEQEFYAEYV